MTGDPAASDPGPEGQAAILTPPGRGGVAVIWVRQPGGHWIRSHFRPNGAAPLSAGRVRAGWIVSGEETIDEVLVRIADSDSAEIHCHGGKAVAERILSLAEEAGFRRLSGEEAAGRLFAGDQVQREALSLLVRAETDEAARLFAAGMGGLLSRRLDEILALDPGDIPAAFGNLLRTASYGIACAAPNEFWLVGRTGAGKSTLMNTLLGWERAIVHDQPGTTRDLVRERWAVEGIPLTLVDTPGTRAVRQPPETEGMIDADSGWKSGRPVILCIDSSEPLPEESLVGRLVPERDLLALTKADLPPAFDPDAIPSPVEALRISALTGEGADRLRDAILLRLAPEGIPPSGTPVIFTRRQEAALMKGMEAAKKGDLDEAALRVRECRWGAENGAVDD